MVKTQHLPFIGILALAFLQSCASAEVGVGGGGGGSNSQGGGSNGNGGSNGGGFTLSDAAIMLPDGPASSPDMPPCPTGYHTDDAGNLFCCPKPLSILSIGQPAKYGAQSGSGDNTDAFQAFMNGNTNGTAKMAMVKQFTSMANSHLEDYDVLILQALEDSEYNGLWSYSSADASTLKDWVNNGGAIIAMTGYGGNSSEVQPLNQLLAPFGVSYNTDDTFTNSTQWSYCTGSSIAFGGWQTSYADNPALTHDLKDVGVFHGRSINCTGSDCQIFAKDSSAGNVGVAKVFGKGRVYAWGDEWVTYTSQWGLTDTQWDSQQDCAGHTAKTSYSVPQFWYNAFRWSVPGNTCFTIIIPPTAPEEQQIVL